MPRSGSWLITVKAFMGFIEIAAAVKFLSNADLVWTLGLLKRPVFLSVWSTILIVAACYMLGWLRLPHGYDSGIGPVRRLIGVGTAVLGLWCLGGITGGSLGEFNAFLPPVRYPGDKDAGGHGGIAWTEDYDSAVTRAKSEGKALFLNFTGVSCTNCRWMEANVFPRPDVTAELENFIPVELYTDKDDPQSERYKKLQEEKFKTVAQPYYAVVTPDGRSLAEFPGLTRNPRQFVEFLRKARSAAMARSR
jgi:thiol:disulfide interchange protein